MLLTCSSYYSLRHGVLSPEELVKEAKSNGYSTIILTDINNTTAGIEFIKHCENYQIKGLLGIDFRSKDQHLYTGIAMSNKGFQELNNFLSQIHLKKKELPFLAPQLNDTIFLYSSAKKVEELQKFEFVGIRPHETAKLIQEKYKSHQEKLLAWQHIAFNSENDFKLHRHLKAIGHNTLLSKVNASMTADKQQFFQPLAKLEKAYRNHSLLQQNARALLQDSGIKFDTAYKNKKHFTQSREQDKKLLENLSYEGLNYRYGKTNAIAKKRLEKELSIIDELGFSAYFLITHDIISFSKKQGFHHVGRGSGANSVVAFCLGITDVDPIELDLYFERFINPKRTSPPDFDIDYSWKERDRVLDYIFATYGKDHTALLGTISTFKGRSIIRELGKVYGLPKEEIDHLIDYPAEATREETGRKIFDLAREIANFPNLRSIHAGGVLISEKKITAYTALDLPPKAYPTTQWDMYTAEEIGFEKLDILSQRGIGHLKDAVEIVGENYDIQVDIHDVKKIKQDKKTRQLLKSGETVGCFYIESPAMRGLLKKLQCDDYLTLVAASSIIRPGVAKSGMMKTYIQRFHHPGNFEYIHPVMKEQLAETYGVMVYQEDVLKVCHHFAGLDLSDADILRRAMSGKFRSKKEFKRIEDKFFSNCKARGYPEAITKEVWRQIESFAGYSFSKAHSASYAVESFQSLYLKAHYPLAFITAVINNFGGFYRTWLYVNEAKRLGAEIKLPCVNNSEYLSSLKGKQLYLGLVHLESLEYKLSQRIVKEQKKEGFSSLDDFIIRTGITKEQLLILIRVGAFAFTGKSKVSLLWEAQLFFGGRKKEPVHRQLFAPPRKEYELPSLEQNPLEDAYDEIEFLGFPVSMSAFDMLQTKFRGEIQSGQLIRKVGKKVRMVGRLVTIKYVKTVRGEIMNFGTFTDHEGHLFDTVHFPDSLKKYPFQGYGIYLLLGKIVEEFGYASMEVEKMARLPLKPDPRGD